MAVAENPVAEKTPRNPQQVLGLGSLVGAIYVLFSLGVIFSALPGLWDFLLVEVLQTEALAHNPLLSSSLLLVLEVGVGLVLFWGAAELEKAFGTVAGLRAGIFFVGVLLVLILWFTRLVALWLENLFENQPSLGLAATLALALGLLFGLLRLCLRKSFGDWLVDKEEQGWFHATTYKPNQGVRVRRGTVVGALALGICGIITLVSHKSLGGEGVNQLKQTIENNWEVRLPFVGEPLDRPRVSIGVKLVELGPGGGLQVTTVTGSTGRLAGFKENDLLVSLRSDNKDLALATEAKLNQELAKYRALEVVKITVQRQGQNRVLDCPLGSTDVQWILLYRVHFTLPLILALLLVWGSWRLVNWPTFADFLIATEAEMNKVSWTTRRRLVQDTIVVLVAVGLLTVFLFVVDIFWVKILNHPWIYVLQVNPPEEARKQQEKTQW